MQHIYRTLLFLYLLVSSPIALLAQAATGELSITVTDPSGAIVKDAAISSDQLNPATGFVLSPTASIARPSPIPVSSYTLCSVRDCKPRQLA